MNAEKNIYRFLLNLFFTRKIREDNNDNAHIIEKIIKPIYPEQTKAYNNPFEAVLLYMCLSP